MDPITTAIVAAPLAGVVSGVTDTAKTTITDAYNKLKTLVAKKCGAKSDIVHAIVQLEAKPESVNRKGMLHEEIAAAKVEQDDEIFAAAKQVLTLVQPQQAGLGKYNIQITGNVQGQNIGDHQQVKQHFGEGPKA